MNQKITKFHLHLYRTCQERQHWLLHWNWQRSGALQGASVLRGELKGPSPPQRHRVMKRAFKRGNESLHMALPKHSPKNFTGMRKTLVRACSNYVQNHKYEKYSQLASPRQIVNKHSFLTWGSVLAVGRHSVGCLSYFFTCTTKIFPLCPHTGSLKK